MTRWRREGSGGLILCGGRSSRMGFEKARLRFPGGTLLERVVGRMRQVAEPVVLSLAAGQESPPPSPGVLTVRDGVADEGPLWGLAEGFRRLAGLCGRVVVMPVDMPFFTEPWIVRLLDALEGHRACLYEHEGFANALTAAYSLELLPKLERLVAEGGRRPMFLCEGEPTRIIPVAEDVREGRGHPLTDVDTPEAYRMALLHEGIGRQGAAEITIELPRAAGGGVGPPSGFVALYADRAADALACVQRLYPELPLAPAAWGVHFRLLRTSGGEAGEALNAPAPLMRGEHLRLEFAAERP